MNGKTIEESREFYEKSGLKHLMLANDHDICTRCYCCDLVSNSSPCWSCCGWDEEDDDWGGAWEFPCGVCGGEGTIYWRECVGPCDEKGHHPELPSFRQGSKNESASSGVNESASTTETV